MVNGKNKGNRGELKICKILNERHSTDQFGRVPGSGAISTNRKQALSVEAMKTLSGDLYSPIGYVFSLEIKTGYDIEFNYLFNEKSSSDYNSLKDFCAQCCKDAKKVDGRIPMVIYAKDRRDPVSILPLKNHSKENLLKENLGKKLNRFLCINFCIEDCSEWEDWVITPLHDLLRMEDSFFFQQ